jgi:hypothetical protein
MHEKSGSSLGALYRGRKYDTLAESMLLCRVLRDLVTGGFCIGTLEANNNEAES